jgi:hypothetical protein
MELYNTASLLTCLDLVTVDIEHASHAVDEVVTHAHLQLLR